MAGIVNADRPARIGPMAREALSAHSWNIASLLEIPMATPNPGRFQAAGLNQGPFTAPRPGWLYLNGLGALECRPPYGPRTRRGFRSWR